MKAAAYYNEIDPYAAQWLRNLIAAGHITPGDVDERSIEDVTPDDIRNYTQCHFFAGIGVWSYALRNAGWPDDKPVWTGSCPCQPFSEAGNGAGFDDARHLWPAFAWLIRERRPEHIFGEQVASGNANAWFDLVQTDLERMDYAFGLVPFPSAGIGAPHIRDRAYWCANRLSDCKGVRRGEKHKNNGGSDARNRAEGVAPGFMPSRDAGSLADANGERRDGRGNIGAIGRDEHTDGGSTGCLADNLRPGRRPSSEECGNASEFAQQKTGDAGACGGPGGLADTNDNRQQPSQGGRGSSECATTGNNLGRCGQDGGPMPVNGFWRDADWLYCRDEKWRPVEPGSFPLADGIAGRVGRLRAYGNAINAEAAKAFITAYMEMERV